MSKKKASDIVESIIGVIKQSLESGEDVMISGFGKFNVKDKKERMGRNPSTGDSMKIAPRRVVTFKCSQKLRDKINKKGK
jgi:integration host factor subunit alpha